MTKEYSMLVTCFITFLDWSSCRRKKKLTICTISFKSTSTFLQVQFLLFFFTFFYSTIARDRKTPCWANEQQHLCIFLFFSTLYSLFFISPYTHNFLLQLLTVLSVELSCSFERKMPVASYHHKIDSFLFLFFRTHKTISMWILALLFRCFLIVFAIILMLWWYDNKRRRHEKRLMKIA